MNHDQLDLVFHAMASQPRRAILDVVRANPGCNLNFVVEQFGYSRIGVMKHIDVLELANLLVSRREGRERLLYFNFVPIQQIHEYWSDEFSRHFSKQLTTLKRKVEAQRGKNDN
jgi:DNA-binding transcriptional ArsR family regulator